MKKFFVVWKNYDGTTVETFHNLEETEKFCADKKREEEENSYGINVLLVVYGSEYEEYKIERIKIVKYRKVEK